MAEYPVKLINKGDNWWYLNVRNDSSEDVKRLWVEIYSVDEKTLVKTLLKKYSPFSLKSGRSVHVKAADIQLSGEFFLETILKFQIYGKPNYIWKGMSVYRPNPSTANEDGAVKDKLVELLSMSGWENSKNLSYAVGGWKTAKQKWYPHNSAEGGNKTIAYGHKLTDNEKNGNTYVNGISDAAAKTLLGADLTSKVAIARTQLGDCWDALDFWAKVLYVELLYNIGATGAEKFKKLRLSLTSRNYGTSADNGNNQGTTWGEYQRGYSDGITNALRPLDSRHLFIKKYILENLMRFKSSEVLSQDAVFTLTSVCSYEAGDDPKIANSQLVQDPEVDAPEFLEELSVDETDDGVPPGVCKYNVNVYEGQVTKKNVSQHTPLDSFEVSVADQYAMEHDKCMPFGVEKETSQCTRLPNEDNNSTLKISFYDGNPPTGTVIRQYKVESEVITVRWRKAKK